MKFGKFFKQYRESLGLSLREYCRKYKLDPGNISKIEQGLVSPPQKKEKLEYLAKTIKLQPKTIEWNTFFNLASTESGRIPSQILDNHEVQGKLPIFFRKLQGQKENQGTWTTALDLETWADSLDSRSTLPQLVRKLIHATINSELIMNIEFPAKEGIQRKGWDGYLETTSENSFIPSGISCWEIGTGKDPNSKAEIDFKKRTESCSELNKKQIHFIFVTPRKWEKKREWCQNKKKLGIWKDVKVYDSANLEEWLELAPAVDSWFAGLIGKRPDGVSSIDEHWENLKSLTSPSFKPDVFLVSRENEVKILEDWLRGTPSSIAFEGRSPNEVIDFISAYMAYQDISRRDEINARILIVDDRNAWNSLTNSINRLILIPNASFLIEAEMIAEAVRCGHHVLLCSHHFPVVSTVKYKLPRVYRYDLEKALVSSGFSEEEASRLARESGGSLTVLKRLKSRFISKQHPEWSLKKEASKLVPLILIGGWNDDNEMDKGVVEKLADHSYKKISEDINSFLISEDPPLIRAHTYWYLISREDSWILLAKYLTRDQLDDFEEIANEVLGEVNPKYELPPDEQWCASIYKKTPKFSYEIKNGIAETLALLGAMSEVEIISDSVGPKNRADRIVRRLFSNCKTWEHWASLSDYLPLLAEASPEEFLSAIEKDISLEEPKIKKFFNQEDKSFFSSSPHTGLLWALETLAWNSSYLARVGLILAYLASIDPGGQLANRPINSLKEIFLPWLPQTLASVDQRIIILKMLLKRHPDIGWTVLKNMLPRLYGTSFPINRPSWRNWTMNWIGKVSNAEYWQQVETCAELLVENLGNDVKYWEELIEVIEHLPKTILMHFIDFMESYSVDQLNTESKRRISDAIRNKVQFHRYHSDLKEAFSPEIYGSLDELQKKFETKDLVARYLWIFVAYPRYIGGSVEDPLHEQERLLDQKRTKAIKEIFGAGKLDKVLELANLAESPKTVGFYSGKLKLPENDDEVLPTMLLSENDKFSEFASGFVSGRFNEEKWDWIKHLKLKNWNAKQAGTLALVLPFNKKTWDLVNELGEEVCKYYWRRIVAFCHNCTKDEVEYAVSMLIKYNRPLQAADVIGMELHNKIDLDKSLLIDTLELGLNPEVKDDGQAEDLKSHIGFNITDIFKKLQSAPDVDKKRLASLEWGYLELLDGHIASPKTLHEFLKEDPIFFAEILSFIYKSREEDKGEKESITDIEKKRAHNAYRLVRSLNTIPGTNIIDGTVDKQKFYKWVTDTREICKESGRLEVCDITIGELLAYAPSESDGIWPCIAVRELIESLKSEEIVRGLKIGVFNKRGIYSKSLTEGGEQEKNIAEKYNSYAKACENEWPKTGGILRSIARNYIKLSAHEDEEVIKRV